MKINKLVYIERHSAPNEYDTCDFGTLCKVTDTLNKVTIYKQISQNSEKPIWDAVEKFFPDPESGLL